MYESGQYAHSKYGEYTEKRSEIPVKRVVNLEENAKLLVDSLKIEHEPVRYEEYEPEPEQRMVVSLSGGTWLMLAIFWMALLVVLQRFL